MTIKAALLVVLLGTVGTSMHAAEETKVTTYSSDSGLLYRFHDPIFGLAIEFSAMSALSNAWFIAKWGSAAGAAYGAFYPYSRVAIPAQYLAVPFTMATIKATPALLRALVELIKIPSYMCNVRNMRNNPDDEFHLQLGAAFFAAAVVVFQFYPELFQYGYNKLPSPAGTYNHIKDKLAQKMGRKSINVSAEVEIVDNEELFAD